VAKEFDETVDPFCEARDAFCEARDPWTRFKQKRLFENAWFTLESQDCLTPGGSPATYSWMHFKNRAVGVIPLHDDGTITLVGQYRYPLEQYSWELPEGGCPEGRTLIDAARMELSEETGLTAKTMEPFLKFHTSNSITDEYGELFLARGLTQGEAHPEDSEELRIRRVSLEALLDEIESGKITDAITIMGAQKLALMKMRGKL
jgi:8-oxo-dGTP pyrophosphatase MutT (NUDIX family)